MATIYKNGGEVGRIDKLTFSLMFTGNGRVLRNDGAGWERWRKLKPDVEGGPLGAFRRCKAKYDAKLRNSPDFEHWRDLVHDFPLRMRALVVDAVRLLPNDPDGLWSELQDRGCGGTFGEAEELLRAYRAAQAEAKAQVHPTAPQVDPV